MATIRPTSSSSVKTPVHGGLEPLSPEVPHFTTSFSTEQLHGNPVTHSVNPSDIVSEEKTNCNLSSDVQVNSKEPNADVAAVSNGAAAPQQNGNSEESLSESDDDDAVPSVTDILTDAGVTIKLDGLQPTPTGQAPLELVTEFLRCVMAQEYHAAKILCEHILKFEPGNVTAQEFYPTIMERIRLDEQMETESSSSSSISSESGVSSNTDDDDDDHGDQDQPLPHTCNHTHCLSSTQNSF
ncbi:glutamate-rich protein 2-like [Dysidea avara]|uniref:glutamate-rich protein 2-like n=1 Tax=Dysidea avara TaxID=196820 RepID=UPI003333992D